MKKKTRRFDEGGFLTKEGKNENIDDDTRARARKFVEDASEESQDIKAPAAKPAAKSSSSAPSKPAPKVETKTETKAEPKAESKPKAETSDEYKERMEGLTKKQALEKVEPEDYVPGPGLLKNLLKRGLKSGLKTVEQKALTNNPTQKLTYDKAKDLATKRAARAEARDTEMKLSNARNYGIDPSKPGSASAFNALRKEIGGGEFSMKKGGSVKAKSASKRADGCAIRGKTRA